MADEIKKEETKVEAPDAKTIAREVMAELVPSIKEAVKAEVETARENKPEVAAKPAFGTAARTEPASAIRYRMLPERYHGIRTYENDLAIQEYLWAISERDQGAIAKINSELAGKRDMTGLSASAGGALVETSLSDILVVALAERERILPRASVYNSSSNNITIPVENAKLAVTWHSAGGLITEDDSTFSEVVLTAKKVATFTQIAKEMLRDPKSAFSVVDIITRQAAEALAVECDAEFIDGDATGGVTEGIREATITETTGSGGGAAAYGAMSYAMFVELFFGLNRLYRPGAVWMMPEVCMQAASLLLDDTDRPIFTSLLDRPKAITEGSVVTEGVILGHNVITLPFATDEVWFGDLSGYGILDTQSIEVTASEHFAFQNDLVSYKVTRRVDGAVQQPLRFTYAEGVTY